MNILVTGARGFIGRNLVSHLQARDGCVVTTFNSDHSRNDLRAGLETADVVYHLAGVNRPRLPEEFEIGNAGLTRDICEILCSLGRSPLLVMASSTQAALENPYGISKRRAEDLLRDFAARSGARVCIFRLSNVFGKWCRPNYNSVVATFCHNKANGLPIQISDSNRELDLVYVDDVVTAFFNAESRAGHDEIPSYKLTLGDLARRIQSFHDGRSSLRTPDFSVRFNQQLYATYLSYVPDDARRQQLEIKSDQRGCLAEFIKSEHFGQIFISRTKPGITRGNHYHHTKAEKFLVVEGEGLIRMRQIDSPNVLEYRVRGDSFQVIDIPPGYTHSIENTGAREMVTLFWSSEIFEPERADTHYLPVPAPVQKAVLVGA
jgi:UDP-2-acetamido-2,6-beta-L-arabino-hexul-4-ose reductase